MKYYFIYKKLFVKIWYQLAVPYFGGGQYSVEEKLSTVIKIQEYVNIWEKYNTH